MGPYEILAPIGAGGMGEVYRARDSRLNREVAIKVSAEHFSDRFEREAHSIGALSRAEASRDSDLRPAS
jgi:serine/threonine-protein kinase